MTYLHNATTESYELLNVTGSQDKQNLIIQRTPVLCSADIQSGTTSNEVVCETPRTGIVPTAAIFANTRTTTEYFVPIVDYRTLGVTGATC